MLRFIPGVYRENPYHQIDLYNPYPFAVEVGEWLVVTRDYSVRLPRGLVLRPYQRFRLGKLQGDLVLERYPDFLIRFPDGAQAGAYVALVDRDGRFRGGLYLAPLPQVPFLPDSGVNIPRTGQRIPFYLPSETASLWQYVPWEPDPVTGVVWIEGKWRYTVADAEKEARLYAPLRFLSLLGAAEGEAVHLVWEVEGRDRCESYRIERWEGHKGWQPLAAFPCPLRGLERREYYDPGVRAEGVYRYRLVYEGGPALRVESLPVEVRWQRKVSSFRMVAKPGLVRLWVAQSQPIKVQLLDAAFAEQVRLYDGWVNGGVENIFIWDTTRVREGCWVVVWTPQRRYWEPLCVR
uniref:Uncharacterized protein n=1 Tax=uncultured Bacteroidota bacterium TaxID=152509 RepID=H5SK42_9BACT|nr:hypothetical protein HGMM_F40B03C16 [uncultured Bacteroidetes bacterium]